MAPARGCEPRTPVPFRPRLEILPQVRPLVPASVVAMNSTVEFLDDAHGETRTVQLVYPGEADIAANKVSVLSPVGAGLLGLPGRDTSPANPLRHPGRSEAESRDPGAAINPPGSRVSPTGRPG